MEKHWTDKHITSFDENGIVLYTGWDETGYNVVWDSEDRNEVVEKLIEYDRRIRGEEV